MTGDELASTLDIRESVVKVEGRRERGAFPTAICICSFVRWSARSLLVYLALHVKVGLPKRKTRRPIHVCSYYRVEACITLTYMPVEQDAE